MTSICKLMATTESLNLKYYIEFQLYYCNGDAYLHSTLPGETIRWTMVGHCHSTAVHWSQSLTELRQTQVLTKTLATPAVSVSNPVSRATCCRHRHRHPLHCVPSTSCLSLEIVSWVCQVIDNIDKRRRGLLSLSVVPAMTLSVSVWPLITGVPISGIHLRSDSYSMSALPAPIMNCHQQTHILRHTSSEKEEGGFRV